MHKRCDGFSFLKSSVPPKKVDPRILRRRQKQKQGLLPVRSLNILKRDGRNRSNPCHAGVVVVESRVPCTLTYNYQRTKLISTSSNPGSQSKCPAHDFSSSTAILPGSPVPRQQPVKRPRVDNEDQIVASTRASSQSPELSKQVVS